MLSAVPDARGLSEDPKESVKLSDPAPLSKTGQPEEEHKLVFPTTLLTPFLWVLRGPTAIDTSFCSVSTGMEQHQFFL